MTNSKKNTQQVSAPDAPAREVAAEWVPITELRPWKDNPRKNDGEPVRKVAESIKRFGFSSPIIARANGEIIAGHTRWKAAQTLKLDRVPVRFLDLDPAEAHLLAIADNRTAQEAEWDDDVLKAVLGQLESQGADLAATGFDAKELEALLADVDGQAEKDGEVIEPPVDPITKPGDLWLLGEHRLLCGDSTKAQDIERLMGGTTASAVISDPPYGVNYVGKTKDALPVHNDGKDTLAPLLRASLSLANENCLAGACWYIAAPPGPPFFEFATVLRDLEVWRQTLVWAKQSLVMGHSDYHYQHESIFYGWKPGAPHQTPPDRKQTTLWHYDRPTASREHPTMKPVELFAKMIENSTAKGSVILEPFCGSGTTLIAAEQLGRKCYGMEISPQYCDVIVKRWETMTGQTAVREPAVAEA